MRLERAIKKRSVVVKSSRRTEFLPHLPLYTSLISLYIDCDEVVLKRCIIMFADVTSADEENVIKIAF